MTTMITTLMTPTITDNSTTQSPATTAAATWIKTKASVALQNEIKVDYIPISVIRNNNTKIYIHN